MATIHVQKFEGSVYVVTGHHAVWLTVGQAQELLAQLAKLLCGKQDVKR